MNFPELNELESKLHAKRKSLGDIFAQARTEAGDIDLKGIEGYASTEDAAAAIKSLNDEINDLAVKAESLKAVAGAASAADFSDGTAEAGDGASTKGSSAEPEVKRIGDLIVDGGGAVKGAKVEFGNVDLKAVFETATGFAPEVTRTGRLVESAQIGIEVIDLVPSTTTGQSAVSYMEETTYTNAAAETAEGVTKPEATLGLTERTAPVRKIAVLLPVTDEQLEDEPRVRGYLNNRLPFMVRQRLSNQIVNGDGTAPNLEGLLNVTGIQTQAKATDNIPDAIYKAYTKVMTVGQAMPSGVVMNPLDWQNVRLLKTTDGIYIWGSPADAGPTRIWGLNVALAQRTPEGTAVVADFSMTELAVRKGLTVDVGLNGTDFAQNKQTLRAEMRAAFIVYRPTAVCTVTGLNV